MGVVDILRAATRSSRDAVNHKKHESLVMKSAVIRVKSEIVGLEYAIHQLDTEVRHHVDVIREHEKQASLYRHALDTKKQQISTTRVLLDQSRKEVYRLERSAADSMREATSLEAQLRTLEKQARAASHSGGSVFQF